ncbi:MAG: aldo/keto reductase [Steroidobacteraceae bacterium]
MTREVELALGTAQFGMAYGVSGRVGPVPLREVREILECAWNCGIRMLDTAPAYGDIEAHLCGAAGQRAFSIVSKIPALPELPGPLAVEKFVRESIRITRARLGSRLNTLLFHRGVDLLDTHGAAAWESATDAAAQANIRLGISCYSPEEAIAVIAKFPIEVAQLPGNAFDQRLSLNGVLDGLGSVEIHLRSVFLQGLLLLPAAAAAARVPEAAGPLAAWTQWRNERRIDPVRAALGVAKSLPRVRYCVVGVDRQSQLEEIAAAWASTGALAAESLATTDPGVIDPRRWAGRQ